MTLRSDRVAFGRRRVDLTSGAIEGGSSLGNKELLLLRHLVRSPGRVVSRDEILREVWGSPPSELTRVVDLTVSRLRRRIEADPNNPAYLKTVYGEGYVLVDAVPDRERTTPHGAFVGRTAELDFLAGWRGAWLTVTGPPGIGKSRLLAEVAGEAWTLVRLESARSTADVVSAIAHALGLRMEALGSLVGWLADVLDGREVVLALDDVDGALEAVSALRDALVPTRTVRVVATSRRGLGFPGEPVLRLGPLGTAEARALLTRLGGDTDDDEATGGNPLAIALYAAAFRATATRGSAERGLDGLIEAMWERLDDGPRRVLGRLSLFAGRFDEEAAVGAAQATSEVLDLLVETSLVEVHGDRYALHPAIRAFARRRLDPGDGEAQATAHASWHLDDLVARLPAIRGASRRDAVRAALARLTDLGAAWMRTAASGDAARLERSLEACDELVARAGLWLLGREWFTVEVPLASLTLRASLRAADARCAARLGEGWRAWEELGAELTAELPHGVRLRLLRARFEAGIAVAPDPDVDAVATEALRLAPHGSAREQVVVTLAALVWRAGADYRVPSREEVDAVVGRAVALREPSLIAEALYLRGLWTHRAGLHEASLADFAQARAQLDEEADAALLPLVLSWQGIAATMLARHDEALEPLLRAEALLERQGASLRLWSARRNRGLTLLMRERIGEADAVFRESREAARRLGFHRLEMSCVECIVRAAAAARRWDDVHAFAAEAATKRAAHRMGATYNLDLSVALACVALGRPELALESITRARQPDAGRGDPRWDDAAQLRVLEHLARGSPVSVLGDALVAEGLPAGMAAWAIALRDPAIAPLVVAHARARAADEPYRSLLAELGEGDGAGAALDVAALVARLTGG